VNNLEMVNENMMFVIYFHFWVIYFKKELHNILKIILILPNHYK